MFTVHTNTVPHEPRYDVLKASGGRIRESITESEVTAFLIAQDDRVAFRVIGPEDTINGADWLYLVDAP